MYIIYKQLKKWFNTPAIQEIRNRGLIHCISSDFDNCKLSSLLYGEESKIFQNCFNIIQHFGDHLKINDPDDGDNGDNIDYLVYNLFLFFLF